MLPASFLAVGIPSMLSATFVVGIVSGPCLRNRAWLASPQVRHYLVMVDGV